MRLQLLLLFHAAERRKEKALGQNKDGNETNIWYSTKEAMWSRIN